MTTLYTVERQYLLPVYKHITIEAESPEAAMRAAMDEDAYDWEGELHDDQHARETYVTGAWEGESAYVGKCYAPPAEIGDPDERLPTVRALLGAIHLQRESWAARQAPAGQEGNDDRDQEEADTVVSVLDDVLRAAGTGIAAGFTGQRAPATVNSIDAVLEPLEGLRDGQDDELGGMIADVRLGVMSIVDRYVSIERASRALVEAYGGDVPDWLEVEVGMLENALAVAPAASTAQPARVVVNMSGGVLHGATADCQLDLVVVDYELGYGDDDQAQRVFTVPQSDGKTEEGEVLREEAVVDAVHIERVFASLAEQEAERKA